MYNFDFVALMYLIFHIYGTKNIFLYDFNKS